MKRIFLQLAAFIVCTFSWATHGQSKSAIQFYDSTGNTATAKVGWTGNTSTGYFFVSTPAIGEVLKSSQQGISVAGQVKATSFLGDGSALTGINIPDHTHNVSDIIGVFDSSKIQNGQYMINSSGSNGQIWKSDGAGRGYWGKPDWDSIAGKPAGLLDSIPNNSVNGTKVKDSSLTGSDISSSANLNVGTIKTSGNLTSGGSIEFVHSNVSIQSSTSCCAVDHLQLLSNGATGGVGFSFEVSGDISYTGTIGQSSDLRYKKDVAPLGLCLDKVKKLAPSTYLFDHEKFPQKGFSHNRQIGVIAQEVEPLFPELVQTDEDGYKSVDYTKLSVVLLKALQEQQQEIEKQSKEIAELKAAIKK
jgi:hypothetical protein